MITKFIETETIIVLTRTGFCCDTINEAKKLYSFLKSSGHSVKPFIERDQFGNIIYKLYL